MYSFKDVKILVVDDEELLREILVETFTMYGAIVDSAVGGHEALHKVRTNNYDMLISDVRMPAGDGLTLMADIKALGMPSLKLFVCSAYNDLTETRTRELNILKVFSKPFDLEHLLRDISFFLKSASRPEL